MRYNKREGETDAPGVSLNSLARADTVSERERKRERESRGVSRFAGERERDR